MNIFHSERDKNVVPEGYNVFMENLNRGDLFKHCGKRTSTYTCQGISSTYLSTIIENYGGSAIEHLLVEKTETTKSQLTTN
ncbi:hypothetical protein JTB14_019133 [Gonioctena quinquepunctata]|nr:hypothetical protein JTB14_019133 [Gonioctena quinquepunctata]